MPQYTNIYRGMPIPICGYRLGVYGVPCQTRMPCGHTKAEEMVNPFAAGYWWPAATACIVPRECDRVVSANKHNKWP